MHICQHISIFKFSPQMQFHSGKNQTSVSQNNKPCSLCQTCYIFANEIKWRDIIKNWTPLDRSDILSRKHKFLKALIATIREDPIKEGAGQEATHCPLKQDGTDSVEGKEAKKED